MGWQRPTLQGRERDDHGISSPWGWRTIGGRPSFHHGQDYYWVLGDVSRSTRLYGVAPGVVSAVWYSNSMGWETTVDMNPTVKTRYSHTQEPFVGVGDRTASNTLIALMGATGTEARGETHLHFEVWHLIDGTWQRVDPEPYFGESPEPEPEKKRKKNMTTRYALIGSGDGKGGRGTVIALAGDVGYPCPGNWDEYVRDPSDGSQADRAASEFQVHGPPIWLTRDQWQAAKIRYTTPPTIGTITAEPDPEVTRKLDDIYNAILKPREVTIK